MNFHTFGFTILVQSKDKYNIINNRQFTILRIDTIVHTEEQDTILNTSTYFCKSKHKGVIVTKFCMRD